MRKFLLLCVILVMSLAGQEGSLEEPDYEPDTTTYHYARPIRLNEWGAGVGGCLAIWGPFNPVTFYPFAYFLPIDGPPAFMWEDDPLSAIAPLWPAYIVVPLTSAAAVYFYGRLMKDDGSAAGSLLGAGLGEAAWLGLYFGARKLFPENVIVAQTTYFSMPLMIGTGTFIGYHLFPSRKKQGAESSSSLMIQPHFAEQSAGVRLTMRF